MDKRKKRITRLAVLLTMCGTIFLAFLVGRLVLRYRIVEIELDRMLIESLAAHTEAAGSSAGKLINDVNAVLDAGEQLLEENERSEVKDWAERLLETTNLASSGYLLSYLDVRDITAAEPESPEYELYQTVLAGEQAFSGFLYDPVEADAYILVIRPVKGDGQVTGALQAKLNADLLSQPEQHSTFFQNVHCVVAGNDGRVVYSSTPKSVGMELASIGIHNGISEREGEAFREYYQENESGAFYYETKDGRSYAAWAPIGYNGWRVVQFSRSPDVRIERSNAVQTMVLVFSLVVCAVLAIMIWIQRAKMEEERLRYSTLAEFKDTLLFEYDCASDSLEFTSNALETLDLKGPYLQSVTENVDGLYVVHPDERENVRKLFLSANGMLPDQIEHDRTRLKKRDGEYSWYRSQYKAIFGSDGQVIHVIGTLTDISSQMDRERELRQQAQRDPLTGLYNRAGIDLINARLSQISRGVLYMLDLDDFKSVNDTYGHAAGDKLLVALARILEETFRTDDIVARVGGDEFIVLLSGSDNEHMANQKAQEMLDRVRALRIEGIDSQASISVGAARAPAHGRSYEALSLVADGALYEVKNGGKGGFAIR